MLLSIEGDEATGKTTLAYSSPLPSVGFAFDMGFDRAVFGGRYKELFDGLDIHVVPWDPEGNVDRAVAQWALHDITVFELPQPLQIDAERYQGYRFLWSFFIQVLTQAFLDPRIASVIIDTMTVARRVKANAHLEKLQNAAYDQQGNLLPDGHGGTMKPRIKLQQIEYGAVNDPIREIFTMAAGVRKNCVFTHHMAPEYLKQPGSDESVATGKRVLEGLADTHRYVDIALEMKKDDAKHTLSCELVKVGYDLSLEGTPMNNPTWDGIATLVEMHTEGRIKIVKRNGEIKEE
jgi:hypothetical protein